MRKHIPSEGNASGFKPEFGNIVLYFWRRRDGKNIKKEQNCPYRDDENAIFQLGLAELGLDMHQE